MIGSPISGSSTAGMTSSLLAQIASSPSSANQFVTGLNQLAQDLQSGNLSNAQQDYVTLSQEALNGAASSASTASAGGITTGLLSEIASSSSSTNSFAGAFNQLGSDLTSGNLQSAESDMLSLDSTALNAVPSASNANAAASPSNKAEISALIQATTEAMEVGDNSAVNADMTQLASASTSSTGAGYLKTDSESYASGSSSAAGSSGSSSVSSVSQLLQSMNADSSSSSGSILSLLA
jgi:hypothetical protein